MASSTKQIKSGWLLGLFAAVLALVLLNGWILHSAFQKVSDQEFWVRHTYSVIDELNSALSETRAGEANAFVYAQTRDPARLASFHENIEAALTHFRSAQSLTEDNSVQQIYSSELGRLLSQRQEALVAAVAIAERKPGEPLSSDKRANLYSNLGIAPIRGLIEAMEGVELHLLAWRTQSSSESKVLFAWILLLTTGISIVVIFFAFGLVRRNQLRNEQEKLESAIAVRESETLAEIANLLSGDVAPDTAGESVLRFLSDRLGITAARLYLNQAGTLVPLSGHSDVRPPQAGTGAPTLNVVHGVVPGLVPGLVPALVPALVKDAFRRTDLWQINDVPGDYWRIESGLGSSVPRTLTFLPLRFQGNAVGVIEMASLGAFNQDSRGLLDKVAEPIAIGLSAASSRRELQLLLEKTQLQSEELQTQQEELKVSNEELEEQAKVLRESQARLEQQQQELEQINQQLEEQAQTLESQRGDLEHKASELETASRYKSEFLANMSHELRTPLNSSLILSKLLAENSGGNLTPEQVQYAETIQSSGIDLLTLINDILDLAKVEAGKLDVFPETIPLESLIESLERMFSPLAKKKGLDFRIERSALNRESIHTDRQRLEQILRNLLSNALKFTEKGSVSLAFELHADQMTFVVTDTGIGIPENQLDSIFEAFHQVDGASNRKFGGTGLGLSISWELAGLLGGKIDVSSTIGAGSRFTLTLPRVLVANSLSNPPQKRPLGTLVPRARSVPKATPTPEHAKPGFEDDRDEIKPGSKVLLAIEDDPSFAQILRQFAAEREFQCVLAATAQEGLELAKRFAPSGIILDVVLPDQTGFSVLDLLKRDPHTRHIPVHVISAQDQGRSLLEHGAVGFLKKPADRARILEALQKLEDKLAQTLKLILIVEDNIAQRESIAALLKAPDTQIIAVGTGTEALYELSQRAFDCVVLDLALPDITGFDLLAKISQLPNAPFPPVIIYTGRDLTRDEEDTLRRYSGSIIVKGARSPERLLDDVSLFLHRLESSLPPEKQGLLRSARARDQVLDGKSVLIVDDDSRNLFALMGLLENRGLKVSVARNGKEALAKLDASSGMDLVLMDIMMPEMDGYEAMREIRKRPRFAKLPIIAVTAKAMTSDYNRCLEAGANDYLPKPIDSEKLLSLMRIWSERA